MNEFEGANLHGTGCSYVKDNKFVVQKWAKPLEDSIRLGFLNHMPYDGWTIAHIRYATHGELIKRNTHPFIVGNWAIAHNGVWSDFALAKLLMGNNLRLRGETDSEVAANVIKNFGPKRFSKHIENAGVFLALNKSGNLWVVKTSGDLEFLNIEHRQVLIASEFDDEIYEDTDNVEDGWYYFNKDGQLISKKEKDDGFNLPVMPRIGKRSIARKLTESRKKWVDSRKENYNPDIHNQLPSVYRDVVMGGWDGD
jgi:predicted glutamine amidotransferase